MWDSAVAGLVGSGSAGSGSKSGPGLTVVGPAGPDSAVAGPLIIDSVSTDLTFAGHVGTDLAGTDSSDLVASLVTSPFRVAIPAPLVE